MGAILRLMPTATPSPDENDPAWPKVLKAGADSVAVISAITKADDVEGAVRRWEALFPGPETR